MELYPLQKRNRPYITNGGRAQSKVGTRTRPPRSSSTRRHEPLSRFNGPRGAVPHPPRRRPRRGIQTPKTPPAASAPIRCHDATNAYLLRATDRPKTERPSMGADGGRPTAIRRIRGASLAARRRVGARADGLLLAAHINTDYLLRHREFESLLC